MPVVGGAAQFCPCWKSQDCVANPAGERGRVEFNVADCNSKYCSLCVHAHVGVCLCVSERVCEVFFGGGTIYLQLSLWEMSNREGRGAWEDLHSPSCVIL